jgi:uncharacterized NAD(P)/FAD-binding protein YdhS
MGMFVSKPGGFLEYAQALDPTVKGSDFLPRRLYGDFLQSRVEQAVKNAGSFGHDVNVIPFMAESLVPSSEGVTIGYGDEVAQAEAAVLAIGSLPPRPLPGVEDAAIASGRYVTDPWPYLVSAPADERPLRVLVIGLGLTAVDVVLELSARWPNANFTALSRHGKLPEPHLASASAPGGNDADLVESMRDDPSVRAWMRSRTSRRLAYARRWPASAYAIVVGGPAQRRACTLPAPRPLGLGTGAPSHASTGCRRHRRPRACWPADTWTWKDARRIALARRRAGRQARPSWRR